MTFRRSTNRLTATVFSGAALALLLAAGAGVLRLALAIERTRTRRGRRAAGPPLTVALTEGSEHAHA